MKILVAVVLQNIAPVLFNIFQMLKILRTYIFCVIVLWNLTLSVSIRSGLQMGQSFILFLLHWTHGVIIMGESGNLISGELMICSVLVHVWAKPLFTRKTCKTSYCELQ